MSILEVGDLKSLRETLCVAQHAINARGYSTKDWYSAKIGLLIKQIDILRPLGTDCKHGNKHTAYCGCD